MSSRTSDVSPGEAGLVLLDEWHVQLYSTTRVTGNSAEALGRRTEAALEECLADLRHQAAAGTTVWLANQ